MDSVGEPLDVKKTIDSLKMNYEKKLVTKLILKF